MITLLAPSLRAQTYEVKAGDNLSDIAYRFIGEKVYGKRGGLTYLLRLNPHLQDPNIILPGQVINLEVVEVVNEFREEGSRVIAAKAADEVHVNEAYSSFALTPMMGYAKLNSSQSNSVEANALSDVGFGLRGDWTLHWDQAFESKFWFEYQKNEFSVSSNKTLEKNRRAKSEIGFEASFIWGQAFKMHAGIGHGTQLFLRSQSLSTLAIDEVTSSFVSLRPELRVLKKSALSMSIDLPLRYRFGTTATNIKTDGGLEYGLGVNFAHERGWGAVEASSDFMRSNNSFDDVDTTGSDLRLMFGVRFFLGKGD